MFCRNCGKELCDDAFVCPNCGCLAKDLPKAEVERAPVENKKGSKLTTVALILCTISWGLMCFGDGMGFFPVVSLIALIWGFLVATVAFIFGLIQKKEKWVKYLAIFVFMLLIGRLVNCVFVGASFPYFY